MALFTINSEQLSAPKENSVVGFAFNDQGFDGQSVGDDGVEGVAIDLVEDGVGVFASTTTNVNGSYSFDNVPPGTYYIEVTSYPSFYGGFTSINSGPDATDSDVDNNGISALFTMASGLQFIIDIGLVPG